MLFEICTAGRFLQLFCASLKVVDLGWIFPSILTGGDRIQYQKLNLTKFQQSDRWKLCQIREKVTPRIILKNKIHRVKMASALCAGFLKFALLAAFYKFFVLAWKKWTWGEFFQVFWLGRPNPVSKIKSDQISQIWQVHILSDSIFDIGFHLPTQNPWKRSPHSSYKKKIHRVKMVRTLCARFLKFALLAAFYNFFVLAWK